MDESERIAELEREVALLREELWNQYLYNHAEHCDNDWPHPDGDQCYWEVPAVLAQR